MFQDRLDITHWGGTQKPWSPTHFWQIAPAMNSGLTSSPETGTCLPERLWGPSSQVPGGFQGCLSSGTRLDSGWGSGPGIRGWGTVATEDTAVDAPHLGQQTEQGCSGPLSAWAPLSSR